MAWKVPLTPRDVIKGLWKAHYVQDPSQGHGTSTGLGSEWCPPGQAVCLWAMHFTSLGLTFLLSPTLRAGGVREGRSLRASSLGAQGLFLLPSCISQGSTAQALGPRIHDHGHRRTVRWVEPQEATGPSTVAGTALQ